MVSIKKLNNPESSDSTLGEIKMGKRVGKYKISARESTLNLTDGGTVSGNLTVTGNVILDALKTPGTDPGVDGQLFCTSSVNTVMTGSAKYVLCSQG